MIIKIDKENILSIVKGWLLPKLFNTWYANVDKGSKIIKVVA
jgi:hypothetical protein